MIFYIIPTIVLIICLAIIASILYKKLPGIASINVESIAKETENKVRNKIILDRLNRSLVKFKNFSIEILKPFQRNLEELSKKLHQKAIEMEKESLKKSQPLKQIDLSQKIADNIAEVEKYIDREEYEQAENLCIDILEIDRKNPEAYELLLKIYIELRDYKKARETARYLVKLLGKVKDGENNHRLAKAYADLGYIYELEDKPDNALTNYQKAVELESNNPRFLDLLLKISIILKDKNLATEAFNNLKKADPDNKKLPELKEEIDNLA